jgi:hypothetical protein
MTTEQLFRGVRRLRYGSGLRQMKLSTARRLDRSYGDRVLFS